MPVYGGGWSGDGTYFTTGSGGAGGGGHQRSAVDGCIHYGTNGRTISYNKSTSRKHGIGASEAAAIVGLDPYRSQWDVWNSKVNNPQPIDSEQMFWGRKIEAVILSHFYDKWKGKYGKNTHDYWTHPDMISAGYVFASPDAIIGWQTNKDGPWVYQPIEAKNVGPYNRSQWGAEGTDNVPPHYLIQTQVQMYCMNYARIRCEAAIMTVLHGGSEYSEYVIPYDERLAQSIIQKCEAFWKEYVLTKQEPPMGEAKELPAVVGKVAVATPEQVSLYAELVSVRQAKTTASEADEKITESLKKFMGHAEVLTTPEGIVLATYRNVRTTESFDWKAFLRDHPDLDVSKWMKAAKPQRRFMMQEG